VLDLPTFVLESVRDLCPNDACIQRVEKTRFKIQARGKADLLSGQTRSVLELNLGEAMVKAIQSALDHNDQVTLAEQAIWLRECIQLMDRRIH
jgi:hypothetical protein